MIQRKHILVVFCCMVVCAGMVSGQEVERALPATKVTAIGGFAGDRINKNREHYLKTFPISKYIQLIEQRHFTAWDWRKGEQPGKWLESAIVTAVRTGDKALEKEARDCYERMLSAQAPDGYLGITADSIRTLEKPLRGMDAYELYFTQHALLTAYEVWKDRRALQAAARLGDYFVKTIGPGKAEFWPSATHDPDNKGKMLKGTMHSDIAGHSIHYSWEGTLLIDPMMRLYQLTNDKKYLDWCKWVVNSIDKWSGWDAYSNLDKVAAGEMTIDKIQPYVHAHTFQMNFLGLLRMYQCTGDVAYLRKVKGAWEDIASRQLYITGGVSVGEHYERDHVKPLTGEMMETCATMSWMQLSQYLLELTGDPKYADAMERICWNQVFAEQTIDGDANHYFTPPNGYTPKGYFREPDCCMGSGDRLLSMLPGFIYAGGAAGNIYINQYMASTVEIAGVRVAQQTDYPQDGKIAIAVDPTVAGTFTVNLRIPSWCTAAVLTVNGKTQPAPRSGSYAAITRVWHAGDHITLELPMALQWVRHDYYSKTSDRKPYKQTPDADAPYALVRGPVVYAVDDIWYGGDTADFRRGWMDTVKYVVQDAAALQQLPAPGKDILGPGYEVSVLLGNGKRTSLPVFPFANIGKWYRDAAHKPDSNAAAWGYAIWLKGVGPGTGALTLPSILGNNMVLQRNKPVPIWGGAAVGSDITVTFGGQIKKTKADIQGQWKLMLDPMPASARPEEMVIVAMSPETGSSSGPGELSGPGSSGIDGVGDTIRLANILVGEVWLCSGQSNMEYSMRKNSKFEKAAHGSGPENELDKADNPAIRIFLVRTNYSKKDTHIRKAWDAAVGAPLRDFSAAGYFFAKELYRQLGVPIGMISASVPGSAIEPFLPSGADTIRNRGKFYETMIRPLAPYSLKGFLWYQGETNCFLNDTVQYTDKMKTLIDSWRGLWDRVGADLPFYFVQIAPFYYSRSSGGGQSHAVTTEPAFWEAQERALSLPHTGMVVTTDLVDSLSELHPAYKWEIGRRLALWALAKGYDHRDVICSGPAYKSMSRKGRNIILYFSGIGGGLVSHDGKPLDWWELAGADGHFVSAVALIKGDSVVVSAHGVSSPVAVRFAWNEAAQPNFYNKEGLPAMPFRTDHPIAIAAK